MPEPRTIRIPRDALVVLCGPAASGKSTFARRYFTETQIVSSDRCRALVFDDETDQSVSGHAFELLYFIVEKRLRLARLTVADATALTRDERTTLLRVARRWRRPAHVIAFDVAVERLIERDRERARTVGEAVIRKQFEKFSQAVASLPDEGFDAVWPLDEYAVDATTVALVSPSEHDSGVEE